MSLGIMTPLRPNLIMNQSQSPGQQEIFMIATGLKRKKMERLLDESKARMRDSSYIYTLKKHGYVINEEYDI